MQHAPVDCDSAGVATWWWQVLLVDEPTESESMSTLFVVHPALKSNTIGDKASPILCDTR